MQKQKTILLIEDESSLRGALAAKLIKEQFLVSEAINGEEGLHTALSTRPDLILLDIVMPVMDGLTMLQYLREDEWGKTVPVIMLTNSNTNENVASAIENDTFEYLVKSDVRIEDIIKKIRLKLKMQ